MNYLLFLQAFQDKYKGIQNTQMLFQYLREELQYLILQILYTQMSYPIYFMGGTKLRLSYRINRFSEDIDLALKEPDKSFPAQKWYDELMNGFSSKVTGFQVHGKLNTNRNVIKTTLSFAQILFDTGLSPLKSQTIKIKIELDTNPPTSATYEKRTYRSLNGDYIVNTHDLGTTFAGKLAAVLFREYQKGRDYYDLQWYLQQKTSVKMNFAYLNANALQQGKKEFKNEKEVLSAIAKNVKTLNPDLMRDDLERFVVMSPDSFEQWLANYIPETLELLKAYLSSHESR